MKYKKKHIMTNFNKPFKAVVVTIAFFSAWLFIMHSSILFGLIGAVCIYALSIKNNNK